MTEAGATFLDRTVDRLGRMIRSAAGEARVRITGQVRPELPEDDVARLRRQIDTCLSARGGEVSARARAAELGTTYLGLAPTGRARFLQLLAEEYGIDQERLDAALAAYAAADDKHAAAARLRTALESDRVRLLRQFSSVPQGVKFLVDLRADLAAMLKRQPELAPLDHDLRELLAGWFDIGFLDLRRIGWDAPASLLEKLIAYESVHKIESWSDLKNRLDSDRRCYAFFHPRMPDEPLIFVEVALVNGIAGDVQILLDEAAPASDAHAADTAIFYSISNCQRGLAGVSFGDFLIKRVVEDLRKDLPKLGTFATLSPMPGFAAWLAKEEGTVDLVADIARSNWHLEPETAARLEAPMLRLAARYLIATRNGKALDRVAHFHLSNGARVERINWLGDTSPAGLRQAHGLMVNYRYKLDEIEANHEAYVAEGQVRAIGAVAKLAKG